MRLIVLLNSALPFVDRHLNLVSGGETICKCQEKKSDTISLK